jgi:methylglutaconyl-CoA hydratase
MNLPSKYTSLILDINKSIATVTLNRPTLRNSFNEVLIAELTEIFEDLTNGNEVRVIILAASGVSFCAGADLTWMKSMASYSHEENLADARRLAQMLHRIYCCPIPVIARVQGDAYGGGVGLAAVCDIVVASDNAHFCLSEARLGLLPATISPYVIRALGEQASRRYFITSEKFSAAEAHRLGFVHALCQPDDLDQQVDKICLAILQNGTQAVTKCKKLVQDFSSQVIDAKLIEDTVKRIADIRGTDEAQVRMRLFLEKK